MGGSLSDTLLSIFHIDTQFILYTDLTQMDTLNRNTNHQYHPRASDNQNSSKNMNTTEVSTNYNSMSMIPEPSKGKLVHWKVRGLVQVI